MKASRFTDAQKAFIINQGEDGKRVVELCREAPAGVRKVPVHTKLIEFGLIDYVKGLRQAGSDRLFPDFSYNAKYGWGRSLSRWFNETFLPKLGLKTDGRMFHSFRHTVIPNLSRADVEEPIIQALVGHEPSNVTGQHYRGSYKLEQLAVAIHKLPYGRSNDNVVELSSHLGIGNGKQG